MPTSSLGHTPAGGGKSPELIRKHEERLAKLAKTIQRGEDAVKKEEEKKK